MNDKLIKDLKETIAKINEEIIEKRELLSTLIDEYQEISDIEIDEDMERI